MSMLKDLREWIQLIFVVVGGMTALAAFFQNLRQRRVENALKFIDLFRDALDDDDLEHWNKLFRSSSELAGAKPGYYLYEPETFRPITDYFSEGSPDGHAISRMAVALDVICHQVNSGAADARTVYYELGQLLSTMHFWLASSETCDPDNYLLDASYPSIAKFFKRFAPERSSWPSRVYAFIE
ncbi:hypothetical protein [Stenotrophomonas sp.]|uniref:hypothetical protein n=1 Tax=Stenotrophomonas sp. TaxID=69392 RepID=UPI0028AC1A94|nr:hypothetical protein [Stenotrophomonas sp.]